MSNKSTDKGGMSAIDVIAIVGEIVAAVARMIAAGVTREQALTAIRSIESRARQSEADVDRVAGGGQ